MARRERVMFLRFTMRTTLIMRRTYNGARVKSRDAPVTDHNLCATYRCLAKAALARESGSEAAISNSGRLWPTCLLRRVVAMSEIVVLLRTWAQTKLSRRARGRIAAI